MSRLFVSVIFQQFKFYDLFPQDFFGSYVQKHMLKHSKMCIMENPEVKLEFTITFGRILQNLVLLKAGRVMITCSLSCLISS